MTKINWGRVVAGGLAAGVVMNLGEMLLAGMVLRMDQRWKAALDALGKPMKEDAATMAMFVGMYLLLGIGGAWLYAAIRPRYGSGPKTAVIAGVALWALSIVIPEMVNLALDIYPATTLYMFIAVSLVEFVAAMLVAGWIYREGETARVVSA